MDLPEPDSPTRAVLVPGGTVKDIPCKTGAAVVVR